MDITLVQELITTLGFPISCVIALAYHLQRQEDRHANEIKSITQTHSESLEKLRDTLDNNSRVIQEIKILFDERSGKND